jgi:hypothetical protein
MKSGGLNRRLVERTRQLLRERPRTKTYRSIADDTGLNVEFLRTLANERTEDASSSRVLTLYEYLSGRTLDI